MIKHWNFYQLLTVLFALIFYCPPVKADSLDIGHELMMQKAADYGLSERELQLKAREMTSAGSETTGQAVPAIHKGVTEKVSLASTPDTGFAPEKKDELKPFGYDMFNLSKVTFEPVQNAAVSLDYIIGPGDELIITVWGETQLNHNVTVNRNGAIVIPTVGLLPVAGVSLKVLTERLYQKMTTSYASLNNGRPGARSFLDVSLGKLKTVRVYVLGEVKTPGGYVLNALSTVFTALYYAGGPTEKGSLREVVLRRAGRDSASIDLYRYLISGDNSLDIHVENGDVVLVKPVKRMVTLQGEVFRPAIYELKEGETFGDLMAIAGGYKHTACLDRIHVQRVVPFTERDKYEKDIIFIDFPVGTTNTTPLEDGDVVTVYPVGKRYQNFVSINGAVEQPGEFELEPAMTVKRLIEKAGGMLPEIFVPKAEIVRTSPDFSQEILSFNVAQALAGNAIDNLQLQNLDKVKIYSINDFKDKTAVTIDGAVRRPGMYPLYDSMTVADLVLQSGGFTDKASPSKEIEVYRQDVASINVYAQEHKVKIPFVLESIEQAQRFVLQQYDMVFVRENPAFEAQKTVQIEGEVLYGGVYPLENDKIRISDIVKKAGGLRSEAFIDACTFKREGKIIYLDLVDALKRPGKSKYDIILIDKDYLHIPKNPYIVDVRGEVMTPTLVLFQKGKGLDYYLEQAGGLSENADDERIQVRLGNGKMWKPRCCWFDPPLKPGTSIVVPVKVEKENKFWENTRDIVGILSSGSTLLYVIYNIIVYK